MEQTVRIPNLRRHSRGYWFCRWGGRDYYFERIADDPDGAMSMPAYLASIESWRQHRSEEKERRVRVRRHPIPLVVDLATRFMKTKQLERGLDCRTYYEKHLKRFLLHYGAYKADLIRVGHLHAIKDDMLQARYSPTTINHDIVAVKSLFLWAEGLELIPPVSFKGVHALPLGVPPDRSMTREHVIALLKRAGAVLRPWLAVNYLAVCRPSEVVRLVHQQGQWVNRHVFRLERGKMDLRTHWPRHIVLTDEALTWLVRCQPRWSRLDSYSQAARDQLGTGIGPKRLEHSAAHHLADAGVQISDIEMLLGHAPPRLRVTYHRPSWPPLVESAGRLALGRAVQVCGKRVAALARAVEDASRISDGSPSPVRRSHGKGRGRTTRQRRKP